MEKPVLVELASSIVADFIQLDRTLQDKTQAALIRARYDLATSKNLTEFREMYEQEIKEKEGFVGHLSKALLGMYTKDFICKGADLRLFEYRQYSAICQNPNCKVTRAGIGFFPANMPEEEIVFTPESFAYQSYPTREGRLICKGCGLEDIVVGRAAEVDMYGRTETGQQKREQVEKVLHYLAEKRQYSPKDANLSRKEKYNQTVDILLAEFSKYYPSIMEARARKTNQVDTLSLYPILEKQAHYLLDMEKIPTLPRGWGKLLKEGIFVNINPPELVIVQQSKSAERLLAKLLELQYTPELGTTMDIHRFRVLVPRKEGVRRLKGEILLKIHEANSGWKLVKGMKINPEDTYRKARTRRDGVEVPGMVRFYVNINDTVVEIQLSDYYWDQVVHSDLEVGEETFWGWREKFREERLTSTLAALLPALTDTQECVKKDPVIYLNILLDQLEETQHVQKGKKVLKRQAIINSLALDALFRHRDILEFPKLSPEDTQQLEERLESIRKENFVPLQVSDEWTYLPDLKPEQRKDSELYLPKLVETPEGFISSGLRGRLKESLDYLINQGICPNEADRVVSQLTADVEEIISHIHIEEEGKKHKKPVYKYTPKQAA